MTPTIKFSEMYVKMPPCFWSNQESKTWLIGVSLCDIQNLPEGFIEFDTVFHNGRRYGHYILPKRGAFLVLTLFTDDGDTTNIWTTIRRWTPEKELYYKILIGSEVDIMFTGNAAAESAEGEGMV